MPPVPASERLRRDMFRVAAAAFVVVPVAELISVSVGPRMPIDYRGLWITGGIGLVGAVATWAFPWHRVPARRYLWIVVPGVAALTLSLFVTGGTGSPVLIVFPLLLVFLATLLELRFTLLVGALGFVGACLPLLQGWDWLYARRLIMLFVVLALFAYIPDRLRRALKRETELSEQRRAELEKTYVATIGALASALDAKDRYTEAHSRETAALAVAVGRRLGLDAERLRFLEYAAYLHDVGKIGMPGHILNKPGPLTEEEMAIMREHPVIGERIIASVPFLAPVRRVVRAEHERLEDDDRTLSCVWFGSSNREEYSGITASSLTVQVGEGITGWVAETKRGAVLGDTEHHPKAIHVPGTPITDESMLAVPVVFEERLLGVLVAVTVGLHQYTTDHLRLLTILANQAAVSIANARLIQRLATAARIDPLTGVGNRRAFEDELRKKLALADGAFAVAMLDVDHLKQTNDAHGHATGDALLRRVAVTLTGQLRPGDLAARWGGDEFLVLLNGSWRADAEAFGNRIFDALAPPSGLGPATSVSIGVAEYPADGTTLDQLVEAADRSMYAAKRQRAA